MTTDHNRHVWFCPERQDLSIKRQNSKIYTYTYMRSWHGFQYMSRSDLPRDQIRSSLTVRHGLTLKGTSVDQAKSHGGK